MAITSLQLCYNNTDEKTAVDGLHHNYRCYFGPHSHAGGGSAGGLRD